eukprot:Lithocolla_globosa_v1_NODE_573_length_3707_cov_10.741512.p1 type:complete len:871 gc:universal NODE_573_length_3707_cov_10.741512:283-2895(+)
METFNTTKIEANNINSFKLSYITCGSRGNPCVIVPPGGGVTKENSLFWARELAAMGKLFVVMYDLRGTGGSEKPDWGKIFAPFGTTAQAEIKRIHGFGKITGDDSDQGEESRGINLKQIAGKKEKQQMNMELMEKFYDYDAHAYDAIQILDELKIQKAHVMGLSQGGLLAQLIAAQFPERVLTCVSAGTGFDSTGIELAAFSSGAEEFYDRMKAARVFDDDGNATYSYATVTKDEYVDWKVRLLRVIVPDFPDEIFREIATKEFETGIVTEEEQCICGLSHELWVRTGKQDRHHAQLRNNQVPTLFVHGRNDPVIHHGQVEKLFQITKNCMVDHHDYGHNFGPPSEQKKILGRVVTFMNKHANWANKSGSVAEEVKEVGSGAFDSGVSDNLGVNLDCSAAQIYDAFCIVQTAADTHAVFEMLLKKLGVWELKGCGLKLFLAIKNALSTAGLNFKQNKLIRDLENTINKTQKLVGKTRHGVACTKSGPEVLKETIETEHNFNQVLVCGAGPIGLRSACELALMGFQVTVVEKRYNFSRANILTFWDETMADMLGLGAKTYFPSLQPTGTNNALGTRQIQVCLLKSFLLLGGSAKYGMEICGLRPRAGERWQACFRPYVKHQRANQADKNAQAEAATEFQKSKDYVEVDKSGLEINSVDEAFLNCQAFEHVVEFDSYIIAEGGWSDSTKKLGFNKSVDHFKPVFGLVINSRYNPSDLKEKNMHSQIHFCLDGKWPLKACPIQAEFIEYLKGETHFFALVVSKKNVTKDTSGKYIEKMEEEVGKGQVPQSIIDQMKLSSTQKGLLEMGVFRQDLGPGRLCLAASNVDVIKLHDMARTIMMEMGLPTDVPLCESNPVQLFDFSRRLDVLIQFGC